MYLPGEPSQQNAQGLTECSLCDSDCCVWGAQRDPSLPVCSVQEGGHESELQPLGVAVTQTQGPGFSNLASNFGLPALATLAQF